VRECLALLRRTRTEWSLDAWPAERPTDAPGPELVALGREESRAVVVAVGRLPRRARGLIETMALLPDADYAEIAERTGMPVGSIGPTRGRALKQLRTGLEHAGFSLSA
jgi:DNA-directed RNA polymerase specialized sigma24 family protein